VISSCSYPHAAPGVQTAWMDLRPSLLTPANRLDRSLQVTGCLQLRLIRAYREEPRDLAVSGLRGVCWMRDMGCCRSRLMCGLTGRGLEFRLKQEPSERSPPRSGGAGRGAGVTVEAARSCSPGMHILRPTVSFIRLPSLPLVPVIPPDAATVPDEPGSSIGRLSLLPNSRDMAHLLERWAIARYLKRK